MEIIITQRFKKVYLDTLQKYFSQDEFIEILKKKSHTFIPLADGLLKFKTKIRMVDFRGVIFICENNKLVPLCCFLKKEKLGYNLSLSHSRDLIVKELLLNKNDIDTGNFQIYKI